MMRLVITFMLSLCFLFVRGYDHLYVLATHNHTCYSPTRPVKESEQLRLGNTTNKLTILREAASLDADNEGVTATETDDDDELLSPRKYVEVFNYFITFFLAYRSEYICRYVKNRLPFCKHFSYTSSDQYIVLRVIRV